MFIVRAPALTYKVQLSGKNTYLTRLGLQLLHWEVRGSLTKQKIGKIIFEEIANLENDKVPKI